MIKDHLIVNNCKPHTVEVSNKFWQHVKLVPKKKKKVDYMLILGCKNKDQKLNEWKQIEKEIHLVEEQKWVV